MVVFITGVLEQQMEEEAGTGCEVGTDAGGGGVDGASVDGDGEALVKQVI